jgi:hypothetical protein
MDLGEEFVYEPTGTPPVRGGVILPHACVARSSLPKDLSLPIRKYKQTIKIKHYRKAHTTLPCGYA